MAVYRKKLVDKDGNTIIPAIGDIYGPVYTAYLLTASGGVATYKFDPDTSVEANRVYAVKFPEPTVNNAVILLGDGNITASSILLPPASATDSPSYEIAYTTNINDTEVWLLMYNGSGQWIALNQKRLVGEDLSSSITSTPAHSAGTNNIKFYRYGDMYIYNSWATFVNSYNAATNYTIGQIPSANAPTDDQAVAVCYALNGDTGAFVSAGRINVNTTGVVQVNMQTGRNGISAYRGQVCWIRH